MGSEDWLDGHWDRLLHAQRSAVDAAKLLTTFTAAIAAGFLTAALEHKDSSREVLQASLLVSFGVCVGLTLTVAILDRLVVPDHSSAILAHQIRRGPDSGLVEELRIATVTSVLANDELVSKIRAVAIFQVIAAVLAGGLSMYALLV